MVKRSHIPVRTCVVCGAKRPKTTLMRTVLDAHEKWIVLDPRRCMYGRGAYVCPECLPRISFTRRVQKAFRDEARGFSAEFQRQFSRRQGK